MSYSFLKKIATKSLAKSVSKNQSKYSRLFDRSEQLDSKKITNFFIKTTKSYFPKYSCFVEDPNDNGFKTVFDLYFKNKIDRHGIPKELREYPELLEVFENCESIVSHLGEKEVDVEKAINAFGFGVFFRDMIKIKMLGTILRKKIILYKKMFCRDWVKHVAWLFVFKRYN